LETKEKELISNLGFKRIKTQKKIFYCEQGKFCYPFVHVKHTDGRVFSPLREYLGLGQYTNMGENFKNKLIMKSSRTTYQKAIEDIEDSFGFKISKKTLNRYVIADAIKLCIIDAPNEGQDILLADSTKVRNGKKGHHEVMGVMSLNYEINSSSLIAFEVNKPPKEIAAGIDLTRYKVFVGDADLGLRNFVKGDTEFHLCHMHAINDISFFLWKDGLCKKKRDVLVSRYKAALYTLKNSTKKYWKDNNTTRLVNRIIRTKKQLRSLASDLSIIEMHQASRYVLDHIEHVTTAAKFALIGTRVPWTTNHAERLMQEIGIRTKKKGMNWTEQGLKAVLNLVLRRYFLPKERRCLFSSLAEIYC
jgi:hypothetical protein